MGIERKEELPSLTSAVMVSIEDSPSLGISLTLASYTCFSSPLISFGRDIFSRVDVQRKEMEQKGSAEGSIRNAGKGDQQHYNFRDHFTFPEFLRAHAWLTLCSKIRVLLRYPMATHTDGVLRRACRQASSHNTYPGAADQSFGASEPCREDTLEPFVSQTRTRSS